MERRQAIMGLGAVLGLLGALAVLGATRSTDVVVEDTRQAARQRLHARVQPPPEPAAAPGMPEIDPDAFDDIGTLLAHTRPPTNASDRELRGLYRQVADAGLLERDGRAFYPRFACAVRCPDDGGGRWPGTASECRKQCAIDMLSASPETHLFMHALLEATEQGDRALVEALFDAYPEQWATYQGNVASQDLKSSMVVGWGRTMRRYTPNVQQSLYSWGKGHSDPVHRMAVAVAGPVSCVWVGGEAVCP